MEEFHQEQRHICKLCNKSCVSGKSLGGHMRIHLALISASKKAAPENFHSEMDLDDQSNISFSSQEKIKTGNSNSDSVESDHHNNSYELRDNPKKSCRFSNSKYPVENQNGFSCKKCGKEFLTTRSLSGHMKCHSMKKKGIHQCKTCGKGFDSMRSMFGHMKIHSKKSRVSDDSADCTSDLDNFCPVRRKRSRIRYKDTSNPSFSSLNEATSGDFEVQEAEIAAACLLMLSRGVRDLTTLDIVPETSSDDSDYFGAIAANDSKISYTNEMNVPQFDDLDSKFVHKIKIEVGFDETCSDLMHNVEEVSDDGLSHLDKASVKLDCTYNSKNCDSTKLMEVVETITDETISEYLKSCKKLKSVLENDSSNNNAAAAGDLDISNIVDKKRHYMCRTPEKEYKCEVCFKVFLSGQALGGHKRAHFSTGVTDSTTEEEATNVSQELVGIEDLFDLNFPVTVQGTKAEIGSNLWWVASGHEQEALKLTNCQINSVALSLN